MASTPCCGAWTCQVSRGQLVAVVGENGAGKSTLLEALAGTLPVDHGSVALYGTHGYCPQDPVLSDNLTVDQHLEYWILRRVVSGGRRVVQPAPAL